MGEQAVPATADDLRLSVSHLCKEDRAQIPAGRDGPLLDEAPPALADIGWRSRVNPVSSDSRLPGAT